MTDLFNLVPFFVNQWKARQDYLAFNETLFDIYEGNLYPYLDADLKAQLGEQSYKQARHRIAPINVLQKIIDKKSKIYQESPTRTVVGAKDKTSQEILDWFVKKTQANKKFNIANEYFNMGKAALIEPYVYQQTPHFRSIKNDRFLVFGMNPVDPTMGTHIMVLDSVTIDKTGARTLHFRAYSASGFIYFNDKEEIDYARMAALENPDGLNPFGVLPFVYVNKSDSAVMPVQDTDMLIMTKLIPLMLTDLNFVSMFSAFSIMYMVDCDDENLSRAPNAVWNIKSDPNSEKKPEIGTIKPDADIESTLGLIQAQFAFWLSTKGIRPGSVGQLTPENFASGISKMVDEGDNTEDRKEQIEQFKPAETQLWNLVLKHMHPVWIQQDLIENNSRFNLDAEVDVEFPPQAAFVNRRSVIDECKAELESGFTTRRRALRKLNPTMPEDEIEKLALEIDVERSPAIASEVASDAADPATSTDVAGATKVQDLSLNGAQVNSLVEVVERVAIGTLPRESAKAIVKAAFNVDDETIERIFGPIKPGSVKPEETAVGN